MSLYHSGTVRERFALGAMAAYWVDAGEWHSSSWWLWLWCTLQSSAAIAYVFVRLEQRRLTHLSD